MRGRAFTPARAITVFDVPEAEVQGGHGHSRCHQPLTCVRRSGSVLVDDGLRRMEVQLADPANAPYVPLMISGTQYQDPQDAVSTVLASTVYDPTDHNRDYAVSQTIAIAHRMADSCTGPRKSPETTTVNTRLGVSDRDSASGSEEHSDEIC